MEYTDHFIATAIVLVVLVVLFYGIRYALKEKD